MREGVRIAGNVLQRPVRQEEADALCFHFAKTIWIASYGVPVGVAAATVQAYRGTETFRFPFWKPFQKIEGRETFFSPDRFGPLRGQLARTAWQASRLGAYWILGAVFGQVFFGTYAISNSLAGRALDPRLKDFNEQVRRRFKEGQGKVLQQARQEQPDGPKEGETMEMARQRREVQKPSTSWGQIHGKRVQDRQRRFEGKEVGDDMSPTSGAFEDEYMPSIPGSTDGMEYGQAQQQQASMNQSTSQPRPRQSQSSPSDQESTGGSGSAWDRVRQTAMSGQSNTSTPRASSSSSQSQSDSFQRRERNSSSGSDSDSFSFSQGEEDKQLAQSEAQKQFDARVEREREGRDFEDGRGGGRGGWKR